MPDWIEIVRRNLSRFSGAESEKHEVIAEIADHLGETYEEMLRSGSSAQEAERRTLATVPDWEDLWQRIQSAKKEDLVQDRIRQFWLPTLIVYVLTTSSLAVIQKFRPQPLFLRLSETGGFLLYVPWLIVLPLLGALAAYLSLRAGGSSRSAILASAFPVVPYAAFFIIGLPLSFIIDSHVARNIQAAGFAGFMLSWVLVPGTALLAGGLLPRAALSSMLRSGRATHT